MSKILWQRIASEIREYALSFPETHEDHPWGHSAYKVKKKVFTFVSLEPGHLGFSMKLPHSNATALDQPFAEPTGYGLGKSGWVSATFRECDAVPVELLKRWMEESYRAIAPKTLVAALDGRRGEIAVRRAPTPPAKQPPKPMARSTRASAAKKRSTGASAPATRAATGKRVPTRRTAKARRR